MSPEFGRLKEPEEPGKGGCKLLNTWEGYQGKDTHARTEIRADTRHISYTDPTQAEEDTERDAHESRQLPGKGRKGNGGKKTNSGCAWCIFFLLFLRMQVVTNEMKKHMTQGDGLYVYAAWSLKLPIVPHHHLLPTLARRYHMVNDKKKDNKKLMKRPVPVNMLVKRVFLLSAESSWNSSSFIWNPGCKKKGPLHKLTTSRRRSKLSIISLNTPEQTCPFLGRPLFSSNAFLNTEPLL